jgi:hypothetical protein
MSEKDRVQIAYERSIIGAQGGNLKKDKAVQGATILASGSMAEPSDSSQLKGFR